MMVDESANTVTWMNGVDDEPLPPLRSGLPLLGSALSLSGDSRRFLLDAYQRVGPIFRVRALNRPMTVMVGPDANLFFSHAGAAHLRSRELWQDYADELGSPHLLNALDVPEHAWQRKVMKPGFSRVTILQRLSEVAGVIELTVAHPIARPPDVPEGVHGRRQNQL